MRVRRTGGFTLVELLVAMGIIAILAGFASLGTGFVQREKVMGASREIYADLQRIRVNALTGGRNDAAPNAKGSGVKFNSSDSYTIFTFNDVNNDWTYNGGGEEAKAITRSMPSSIQITSNKNVLIFDRLGYPRGDNWSAGWMTVIVQHRASGYARCIRVHTNRIREGAWDGKDCALI